MLAGEASRWVPEDRPTRPLRVPPALTLVEGSRELGAHIFFGRAAEAGLQRHGHEEGGVGGAGGAAVPGGGR